MIYANIGTFTSGVYNPPVSVVVNNVHIPTYSTRVNITVAPEHMKYVIGVKGYYFNAITHCSGALYIWYHKDIGVVEIVGFPGTLADAETRLKSRMSCIGKKQYTKQRDIEWPVLS